VARMIISQMNKSNSKFVYLDITHRKSNVFPNFNSHNTFIFFLPRCTLHCFLFPLCLVGEVFVAKRFPAIYKHCLARGLNLGTDLIPVVPAAHYSCGGIEVDLLGQTSLPGLYAVGEVSCTGLHGANRLASTSLLEGMVWGSAAVKHMYTESTGDGVDSSTTTSPTASSKCFKLSDTALDEDPLNNLMKLVELNYCENVVREEDEDCSGNNVWLDKNWFRLRSIMWSKVGIVRHPSLLKEAVDEIKELVNQSENAFRIALATSLYDKTSGSGRNHHSCCLDHSVRWLNLLESIESRNSVPYEQCLTTSAIVYQSCENGDTLSSSQPKWQDLLGFRNACLTAHAIAESALNNPTSAGAHFVVPDQDEEVGGGGVVETKGNN
jgi:aspartate oxidase